MFGGLYHSNFVSTSGFTALAIQRNPRIGKACVVCGNHNRMPIPFPSAERKQPLLGGLEPWNFIFHFIYGMSSFPLTNMFQDG